MLTFSQYVSLISIVSMIVSCSMPQSQVVYVDGKQKLNLNRTDEFGEAIDCVIVRVTGKDTLKSGEAARFRMFLNSTDYDLVEAYIQCNITNESFIDTTHKMVTPRIVECKSRLPVRSDSVIVEFTVGGPGPHKFLDVTLISRDQDNIFRYHRSTFNYFATESED